MSEEKVTIKISANVWGMLKILADKHEPLSDDFSPDDIAGGNVDDAFYGGESYGRSSLASDIIADAVLSECEKGEK